MQTYQGRAHLPGLDSEAIVVLEVGLECQGCQCTAGGATGAYQHLAGAGGTDLRRL